MRRLAAALLVTLAAPAGAQEMPPDTVKALDALIAAEMEAGDLPSVAVSIQAGGLGVYETAVGAANVGTGAARLLGDPFRIGSVTKAALATVVLQLAAEKKLALDAPVEAWFPGFPNAGRITVEDLLRMQSGIVDPWDEAALDAFYDDPLHPPGLDEMIARAAAKGADFAPPGEATVYANVNYLMLDRIVSAVEGRPTGEVLADRLFAPLALSASEMPEGPALRGALHGYGWNAGTKAFEDRTELEPGPVGGAGAMVSSAADLVVLVRAICEGELLPPDLQAARMEVAPLEGSPAFVGYGEGVARLGPFCGHNGTIMGFSTEAWHWPERDATIVVNVSRLDRDDHSQSSELFLKIAKLLYPNDLPW